MAFKQRTRNRDLGGSVVEPVKSGGENKTPAPVHPAPVYARTANAGYGCNGDRSQSSILPGQKVESILAADLRQTSEAGGDGILDRIIAHGASNQPVDSNGDVQTRKIDPKSYPIAHGCHPANGGPRSGGDPAVPSILDKSASPLPRRTV